MENKVTVIVPVYNTRQYLEECVRSITAQSYRNLEILLIDDGSTDGSGALCEALSGKDDRVRVVHKPNGGAASARNLGIEMATGEYILFVDSDDWLDTDAVETLVKHADQNKTDVIRFNYVREYKDRQVPKINTFLEERVYLGEECRKVRRQILGLTGRELEHPENMRFLASCGFNLYRRSVLVNANVQFVPVQKIGAFEDGLFNFCVFSQVNCFEFLDKAYYHYRKNNEAAVTANYRQNYINRQLGLFEILKAKIEEENAWDFYQDAFESHLVYASMEIAFNAMRNKASWKVKYQEIKRALHHPFFREAYQNFNLNCLRFQWKVYFFLITRSMALPTFLMTAIILNRKNKGIS